DGAIDGEEQGEEAGCYSRPGGQGPVERLRKGAESGPFSTGRAGRSAQARLAAAGAIQKGVALGKLALKRVDLGRGGMAQQRRAMEILTGSTPPVTEPAGEGREGPRPAPRLFAPDDPLLS